MPFNRAEYWKEYRRNNAGRWTLKKSDKPIKPISKNRSKALREYEQEKKKFFQEVTVCQFPGCGSNRLTLHHSAGRIGKNLTDRSTFRALCWEHHQYCETHPNEAKRLGLSVSRLTG